MNNDLEAWQRQAQWVEGSLLPPAEHGRLLLVDVYDKDEQDDLSVQDIARIRKGLGYSQTVFARVLAVWPQTVRGEGQ